MDYEKVKKAHELADQAGSSIHYTYQNQEGNYVGVVDLDQLFLEMEHLMKTKSKYKVGDTVWTYFSGEIKDWIIEDIRWESDANDFRVDLIKKDKSTMRKASFLTKNLYQTRWHLIIHQLEYWQQLRNQEIINSNKIWPQTLGRKNRDILMDGINKPKDDDKKCEHESDGTLCVLEDEGGVLTMNRCKKCKDLYK